MNKKLSLAVGTAVLSASFYSASLTAVTVTANASADVIAPLTLVETTAMYFGNIAGVSGATSTVVLDTTGGTSSADLATTDLTGVAGAFSVTGQEPRFCDDPHRPEPISS